MSAEKKRKAELKAREIAEKAAMNARAARAKWEAARAT